MKNNKGMTLIEVMVALAIFSIAAVAIMKSVGQQINNLPKLEQKSYAQYVADNIMTQTILEKVFPDLGETNGETDLANQKWYWRQKVIKTESDDFRMIRVSVGLKSNFDKSVITIETYVYKDKDPDEEKPKGILK